MVTLLKHGGQQKSGGDFIMSNSFTIAKRSSDYVDDGKFSSDDDCPSFPAPVPKTFILPPSASSTNLLKAAIIKNDSSSKKNTKTHLARKNSAPLSQISRKTSNPPPLPPQKPKISLPVPTTFPAAIKTHNLVRSESAPSASLSNGFKIVKETLAAELSKIQDKDEPDRDLKLNQTIERDVSSAKTKLPPPPIHSTIKKTSNHRSHSCANSSSNHSQLNVSTKSSHVEEDFLEDFFWFHSSATRQEAERKLNELNTEGGFLIRYKSDPMPNVPYAMSVFKGKVYHLEIRQKQNGNLALGDFKEDELEFACLQAMVNFYKRKPLQLVRRSSNQVSGSTHLITTPPK